MAYADLVLAEASLLSYWKLDETTGTVAVDSKGTDDLAIAGAVTLGGAKLAPGLGASATFSRAGSGRASCSATYPEGDVTVEGWFRCDDPATIRQALWCNGTGGASNGNALVYNGADTANGKLWHLVVDKGWIDLTFAPDTLPHHIVYSRAAGPGTVTLYVDGVEIHEQYVVHSSPPAGGFTLAAEKPDGTGGFTGAVSDLAVYATVLDAQTILDHYYEGTWTEPPPYVPPTHEELLAEWETNLYQPHHTGTAPYDGVHPPGPNSTEHYDPLCCFYNARDYCLRHGLEPSDWDTEIANAVAVWRDQYILTDANGGQLQGYHTHTHGLARHYLETGEPESLAALLQIMPATLGLGEAGYYRVYQWSAGQRENAFKLLGCLDYEMATGDENEALHWAAECALSHCNHFVKLPAERYAVFIKPFMWGLVLRSLIAYWFRYRTAATQPAAGFVAQIPALVKQSVERMMEIGFWPPGEEPPLAFDGSGATWPHGSLKYISPDGTEHTEPGGSHVSLMGLTVVTKEAADTFIGPAGLSPVDDYYKELQYVGPNSPEGDQAWVVSYEGATRRFVIRNSWNQLANVTAGDTFELRPYGWGDAGTPEGPAPDGASPMLNPLVAPAAAWSYWHQNVVLGDSPGAAIYREHHETLWSGQGLTHQGATQKEWNEGLIYAPSGIGYRDAGDNGTETTFDSLATPAPIAPPSGVRMLLRRNATPGTVPAPEALTEGELALNTADGLLFTKLVGGSVVQVGGPGGGTIDESNLVHKTGIETITGTKTFTAKLVAVNPSTSGTTEPWLDVEGQANATGTVARFKRTGEASLSVVIGGGINAHLVSSGVVGLASDGSAGYLVVHGTSTKVQFGGFNSDYANLLERFSFSCGGGDGAISLARWSTTTQGVTAVALRQTAVDNSHATRKYRGTLEVADYNGLKEALRVEADGTAARIGFLGAPAVARPTGDLGAALLALGLVAAPTTVVPYRFGAAGVITTGQKAPAHRVRADGTATRLDLTLGAGTATAAVVASTDGGATWPTTVGTVAVATGLSATVTLSTPLAAGTLLRVDYTAASGTAADSVVSLYLDEGP